MKQCHVNSSHYHLNSLSYCPWCHIEAATGIVLFNIYIRHGGYQTSFDIAAVWAKIESIEPPGPPPKVADRLDFGIIRPSNKAVSSPERAKRETSLPWS